MTITDYEFYTMQFNGIVIPTEQAFKATVIKATAYVDTLVTNKTALQYGENEKKYRYAVCAVADEIYKQAENDKQQKVSETVGDRSVSYINKSKSDAEFSNAKYNAAADFLTGSGLMYRGI